MLLNLIGHLYLCGGWLGVDLRKDTKTCSKFVKHARLYSQHDQGDLCDLMAHCQRT